MHTQQLSTRKKKLNQNVTNTEKKKYPNEKLNLQSSYSKPFALSQIKWQ